MLIQWSSPLPVLVLEKPLPAPDAAEEVLVSADATDVPPEFHPKVSLRDSCAAVSVHVGITVQGKTPGEW